MLDRLLTLARAGIAAKARADDALAQLDLERAESALAFKDLDLQIAAAAEREKRLREATAGCIGALREADAALARFMSATRDDDCGWPVPASDVSYAHGVRGRAIEAWRSAEAALSEQGDGE